MQDPGHAAPNGVHAAISPELAVSPAINGADAYSAHSPAADSPATPVSTAPAPDVKIDLDYPEQESDVRNEPIDIKHIAPFDQDMAVASRMSLIVPRV
jgi:bromodomain-containing factor 1